MTDEPIVELQALRSTPPLRESDYAAIRARVRAGIARKRTLSRWWRFATVAALVVLVIGGGTLLDPRPESPVAHKAPPAPRRSLTPPQAVVMTTPEPVHTARPTVAVRRRKPRPASVAITIKTEEPMRIQMATADPDVRIIWIVHNTEE